MFGHPPFQPLRKASPNEPLPFRGATANEMLSQSVKSRQTSMPSHRLIDLKIPAPAQPLNTSPLREKLEAIQRQQTIGHHEQERQRIGERLAAMHASEENLTFGSPRMQRQESNIPMDVGPPMPPPAPPAAMFAKMGIEVYPGTKPRSSDEFEGNEADDTDRYIDTADVSRIPTLLESQMPPSTYNRMRSSIMGKGSPLRMKNSAAATHQPTLLKHNKSSTRSLK